MQHTDRLILFTEERGTQSPGCILLRKEGQPFGPNPTANPVSDDEGRFLERGAFLLPDNTACPLTLPKETLWL